VREVINGEARVDSPEPIHLAVVIGTQEDNRVHPGEVLIHVCGQEFTGAAIGLVRHASQLEELRVRGK
jgi:hypothetical protein